MGGYRSAGHIATGSIEQRIHAAILCQHIGEVLLHYGLVHHIGHEEHAFTALFTNLLHDSFACLYAATHYHYFGSLLGQIQGNSLAQHSCAAREDDYAVFDVEKFVHNTVYLKIFCY